MPVAALPQWELSMKVVQLLGLQGPWWRQVFRDTDCLRGRSYGPIRVFQASCSWWSEGLFGRSFSVGSPVQALRGIPSLGSLSAVPSARHIEGPPWLGPYCVVQCLRHLMGQPLYCSAVLACGEREVMVMAPPSTRDSAVSPCFHGCLAFLHRHFSPGSPPSHTLHPSLHSQQ